MKAVQQIITYLRASGLLERDQLVALAAMGFDALEAGEHQAHPDGDAGHKEDDAPEPWTSASSALAGLDPDESPARRRPGGGGKGGRAKHARDVQRKGTVLSARALRLRLRECFKSWGHSLRAVVRIAHRLPVGPDDEKPTERMRWREALVVIRNAEPEALARAVAAGLVRRDPPLDELWEAISVADYRKVLGEPGAHGPAVSALRAILAPGEIRNLGRHARLLRWHEVAHACNLAQAQRRLLGAVEWVYTHKPEAIAAGLQHDFDVGAYWALVLLHNARRFRAGQVPQCPAPQPWELVPLRRRPDDAGWLRAWAQAVVMDGKRVTPFLLESQAQAGLPERIYQTMRPIFESADDTTLRVLYLHHERRLTLHQMNQVYALDEDVCARKLRAFHDTLRQAVERAHPLLFQPPPEGAARWDAFVVDHLGSMLNRWITIGQPGCTIAVPGLPAASDSEFIRRHYGDVLELACPRSWNWRIGE